MSQPPKSTIRAPAARWLALSGVCLSKGRLPVEKRRGERSFRFAPSVLLPERLRRYSAGAPSVDRRLILERGRSPDANCVRAVLLPERLRELRLRRPRRFAIRRRTLLHGRGKGTVAL